MKKFDKKSMQNKWSSLVDSMSGERKGWLEQYDEMHKIKETGGNSNSSDTIIESSSLLPISMKISVKTLGQDLVSVQPMKSPMGIPSNELEKIISRIKQENRTAKIDSIVNEREFIEKELENDDEYNKLLEEYGSPIATLMYLDYVYGNTNEKSDE